MSARWPAVPRRLLVAAATVAALVAAPAPAWADPSQIAADISSEIMSPFCPGLTLHDCPSAAAERLRDRIEGWARAGLGRDAIMARLRADYGPAIAATPPRTGAGLLAWVLPAAAVLAAGAAAWTAARRWSSRRPQTARPEPSSEERRRLAEELAELRRAP